MMRIARKTSPLFIIVILVNIGMLEMVDGNQKSSSHEKITKSIKSFFALEGQMITPQQISEQIVSPSLLQHPDLGQILKFRGKLGTLWLSSRNNIVYYSGNILSGMSRPTNAQESYELAINFTKRHIADFEQRNFELDSQEVVDNNLTLQWTEHRRPDIETSIFSNWIEIVVDLTQGHVKRFSASDLRLTRTTPPKINKEQAEARIKAMYEKVAIDEIDLMELPVWTENKVITIWNALVLTLEDEGPMTSRVTINADTGEIIPE